MPLYLLHLERPYRHARHYLGFTRSLEDLDSRLNYHRSGRGSKMLRAVTKAGISWTVTRVWDIGSRTDERRLKRHDSTRYCPLLVPVRKYSHPF